jgi:cytochrome c556
MKFIRSAIMLLAVAGVAATAQPVFADGMGKAVASRQAQMKLYSWNLGRLGAMAKTKAPYDAKVASAAANNLMALAKHDSAGFSPKGSDRTAMAGKTRAKAEIWTTYPEVKGKSEALVTAATALAAVAGNGLEALQGAIGAVGKSCGGCHKPFRAKKN